MKDISVFSIHPDVKSTERFIEYYHLEGIQGIYNFIWDEINPQYVFCSEHIYYNKNYYKKFKTYFEKKCILIFYAGECIYPDLNIFDYGVCWDYNVAVSDRITGIVPCEIMFKNFFIEQKKISTVQEAKDVLDKKEKFCNFLYSNSKAHPMRDQLFYKISEYQKVDSLGKHLNNVGIQGTGYMGHYKESTYLKMPYKFSIAAENASYEGYTSEKILTSFQAHTIPIYWGNPVIAEQFNEKAFINVHSFKSFDELIKTIKQINESDELWCKMISEPYKTEEQIILDNLRMQNYINFFENIFSTCNRKLKRAPEGSHPSLYKRFFMNVNFNKILFINLKSRIENKIEGMI